MCGIVGFTGSQNAAPILLDGLKKLEYRGYDSAGMAVLGGDGIRLAKTSGMIRNLDSKTQGGALRIPPLSSPRIPSSLPPPHSDIQMGPSAPAV